MARKSKQKMKLLYLAKIFLEETDDENRLTTPQIIDRLDSFGVDAGRKSLYDDYEALRSFGLDIIKTQEGKQTYYHVGKREFELAELKMLVDSIQASRFITEKKAGQLIRKIVKLTSRYKKSELQRQVYVSGRIRSMNESIYYSVDAIHNAISQDKKIGFRYFGWGVDKKPVLHRDGEEYSVSPWLLHWNDGYYYLVGYDDAKGEIRTFRVDKMLKISLLSASRTGKDIFEKMDNAKYSQKRFFMFDGEEQTVTLRCKNWLSNVIIDRFGKDVAMLPEDENHFTTLVDVVVSDQFYGWLMSFGNNLEIISPDWARERITELAGEIKGMYG
ncbi:MAG: WYL domain-containing protein [Lachnospiraceae bacterium]|nr:WYL domain-containing protein [Lachnospiraceae bacterium]